MTNTATITQQLHDLTSFINDALARLEKGEVINLSHLDDEVDSLCGQAIELPPAEAAKIQEPMAIMINKLEQLGIALKDFQTHLKNHYDID